VTAFLYVKTTQLLCCRQILQRWCRSTPSTLQCRRYHSCANYLMAGGRLPPQLQHWPGFWALEWMLGPLSPILIHISPSASDPCSRTCVVTLWCNRLHLTGTVDCWCTPRCLVCRRGYSYINDSVSNAPGSIYDRLRGQTRLYDAGQH